MTKEVRRSRMLLHRKVSQPYQDCSPHSKALYLLLSLLVGRAGQWRLTSMSSWSGGLEHSANVFALDSVVPLSISLIGEEWDHLRFVIVRDCDSVLCTWAAH